MGDRVEYEETSWLSKGYGLAPFLLMSNPEISIGAKGLFCYLSSIAGAVVNEEFGGRASWPSRARICRDLNINKDTFTSYLEELKMYGFIKVVQKRMGGKFASNVYVIQEQVKPLSRVNKEKPQLAPCPKLSDTALSDTVFSDTNITNDLPLPNNTINSIYSVADIAPDKEPAQKGKRKATVNLRRAIRRDYPGDFNRFWDAYPRKDDKAAAFEIYKAILSDRKLGLTADDLFEAAKRFAREMELDGREKKHIKLCKTWLNNSLAEYLPETEDYKQRAAESSDPFTFSDEIKAKILGQ